MNIVIKRGGTILLIALFSSLFCLSLYFFDNKYTKKGPQPLEGLLVLTKKDLEEQKIFFPIQGWAYYPGVLLNPSEKEASSLFHPFSYIALGEHTGLKGSSPDSLHGKGSYVLHLQLPKEPSFYAIALPEIFSAYHFYVNDKLFTSMGNPDPTYYSPLVGNRMILFEGSGMVTLTLAVSDFSHYYSGLVYPPAFGPGEQIASFLSLRLLVAFGLTLFCLLGALIGCYLGFYTGQKRLFLLSLICILSCVITSYPIVYSLHSFSHSVWYLLELTCTYLVTALILLLQYTLCETKKGGMKALLAGFFFFCLLPPVYATHASQLTLPVTRLFSIASWIFKIAAALLLIFMSFLSSHKKEEYLPLFYSSLVYGFFLLWDRILPSYEPIYFGWFPHHGNILLILAMTYTLLKQLGVSYQDRLLFLEESRHLIRQLSMQLQYNEKITEGLEEKRRLIHDFRHHLRMLQELSCAIQPSPESIKQQEALTRYLKELPHSFSLDSKNPMVSFSSRPAVDALLQYYQNLALSHKIRITITFSLPEALSVTDRDWCIILGNLLENAIEHCAQMPDPEKASIRLTSRYTGKTFFLLVENTSKEAKQAVALGFPSKKRGGLEKGVGLRSVIHRVSLLNGQIQFHPSGDYFRVEIIFSSP